MFRSLAQTTWFLRSIGSAAGIALSIASRYAKDWVGCRQHAPICPRLAHRKWIAFPQYRTYMQLVTVFVMVAMGLAFLTIGAIFQTNAKAILAVPGCSFSLDLIPVLGTGIWCFGRADREQHPVDLRGIAGAPHRSQLLITSAY
jgi:hypothetical protein